MQGNELLKSCRGAMNAAANLVKQIVYSVCATSETISASMFGLDIAGFGMAVSQDPQIAMLIQEIQIEHGGAFDLYIKPEYRLVIALVRAALITYNLRKAMKAKDVPLKENIKTPVVSSDSRMDPALCDLPDPLAFIPKRS